MKKNRKKSRLNPFAFCVLNCMLLVHKRSERGFEERQDLNINCSLLVSSHKIGLNDFVVEANKKILLFFFLVVPQKRALGESPAGNHTPTIEIQSELRKATTNQKALEHILRMPMVMKTKQTFSTFMPNQMLLKSNHLMLHFRKSYFKRWIKHHSMSLRFTFKLAMVLIRLVRSLSWRVFPFKPRWFWHPPRNCHFLTWNHSKRSAGDITEHRGRCIHFQIN